MLSPADAFLRLSLSHKENAILAFGNGTYLNAAVAPSIPPTTQMYKQERNANRAVATLRENIFEHLQPTKVGEPGPRGCLALSVPAPCLPALLISTPSSSRVISARCR